MLRIHGFLVAYQVERQPVERTQETGQRKRGGFAYRPLAADVDPYFADIHFPVLMVHMTRSLVLSPSWFVGE